MCVTSIDEATGCYKEIHINSQQPASFFKKKHCFRLCLTCCWFMCENGAGEKIVRANLWWQAVARKASRHTCDQTNFENCSNKACRESQSKVGCNHSCQVKSKSKSSPKGGSKIHCPWRCRWQVKEKVIAIDSSCCSVFDFPGVSSLHFPKCKVYFSIPKLSSIISYFFRGWLTWLAAFHFCAAGYSARKHCSYRWAVVKLLLGDMQWSKQVPTKTRWKKERGSGMNNQEWKRFRLQVFDHTVKHSLSYAPSTIQNPIRRLLQQYHLIIYCPCT